MKYKALMVLAAVPIMLTGCMQSKEPELTPEELEHNALVEWFETGMANEDKFPDLPDYRYYARTIGLDKDGLIKPDMWEIFCNENININRDIDGKAILTQQEELTGKGRFYVSIDAVLMICI